MLKHASHEITDLHVQNRVFWQALRKVERHPKIDPRNSFVDWMVKAYVSDMTTRIRRILDGRRDVVSFLKLLEKVKSQDYLRSRQRHLNLYGNAPGHWAASLFDGLLARSEVPTPGSQTHLPSDVVAQDFKRLKAATKRLLIYANNFITHTNWDVHVNLMPIQAPTFDETKQVINLLDSRFRFYRLLLEAASGSTLMPTWQYPWERIFNEPWNEKKI